LKQERHYSGNQILVDFQTGVSYLSKSTAPSYVMWTKTANTN